MTKAPRPKPVDGAGKPRTAVVCGAGALPYAVADAAMGRGREVVLFAVRGWADPARVQRYRHHWVALGTFGRWRRLAKAEGCQEVVFIGAVLRPAIRHIRLDWHTLRLLRRIAGLYRGGDDQLLCGLARIVEEHGFRVVGAHEVAPELLVPKGAIGSRRPTRSQEADIARGLAVLAALAPFDIGQAVVVAHNQVVAIEAAEGTDSLLARIAELRRLGRINTPAGAGVLVKAPKRGQDHRFDLPAIGPATVRGVVKAGLAGVAVAAGGAIMAEPARVAVTADDGRVFVVGVDAPVPEV
jgi:UDP-2,3-diacylglucosamine hydrolase